MTAALQSRPLDAAVAPAMIGDSEPMLRLRGLIATVGPTRLPVLIHGPTGAGKELVAAAIHAASGRDGAFVPFNVCAISDTMFEDAVFGHVRGAFTGAWADSAGFLREADGGTAFFDEIGGLDPAMQAKLLRAIETGVFRPVGAKRDVVSDFRLVSATNENPGDLVRDRRFRSDFVHRIGAVVLEVPPHRERPGDIPMLVDHFLDAHAVRRTRVTGEALALLGSHDWPGNVRELRHVVDWAAAMSPDLIGVDVVRAAMSHRRGHSPVRHDALDTERSALRETLMRHHWNVPAVAEHLGVHRTTLYRRMKRLGIPNGQGISA